MKKQNGNSLLEYFSNLNSVKRFKQLINKLSKKDNKIFVSQFPGSTKSLLLSILANQENQIIILLPSTKEVSEVEVEISLLKISTKVITFLNYDNESIQKCLSEISNNERYLIIADYKLLQTFFPPKEIVKKNIAEVTPGGDLDYDELLEYLNLIDYSKDSYVDMPGTYAVRGSIIDFWSYSEQFPVRIEFDGDFLESIRSFDPENQRTSGMVKSATLASKINVEENTRTDIFDHLTNPLVFVEESNLLQLFSKKEVRKESGKSSESDLDEELLDELFDGEEDKTKIVNEPEEKDETVPIDNIEKFFSYEARFIIEKAISSDERIEIGLYESPSINSSFEVLFNLIDQYVKKGYQIFLTTENEIQGKRLGDLLGEFRPELADFIENKKIKIIDLPIKSGFINKTEKILLLSDYQIFNKPYRTKLIRNKKYKRSKAKDLASIKRGDYVVHEDFGIGRYIGLETIKIGQIEQESIKIQFADNGIVYVNLNYLSLIKKFSSKENGQPTLSKLGSNEWKRTKKKVKSKIEDAARELIKLYAERKATRGFAFSSDSVWQKELEASFFYEDTPDQSRVTEEVKADMEQENPMDRLVCGDVGFGKTEIAVRAAFKAVNDGKQVCILVPTTILAEQHFNTFKDRMNQFPVRVEALSRFQTKTVQNEIVLDLGLGKIDIIIGTHRLLSKDIRFKDIGLLIIDEEHRFGVMAKEKLRKLKAAVDTLTLTATPIPRTLNMSLLGARDLSVIATPPPNRMPIYTKVEVFDILKIRQWIMNEIARGGQVYFIHDRVQSIEKMAGYLQKHIPEINCAVAHGQMKPNQLENVIHDFLNRKYNVLLSTKIIESGIDIPNSNSIIINRADRFGLAQLHQLRGRVGRSNRQAYAYLIVPSMEAITKKAVKRLQAIEEYTDLGEGFNLAMRDLEIRGAGNLLGTEQSGVIDSVGFDLYMKLLDETVANLKSGEFKQEFTDLPKQLNRSEPTIDTFFEIGIPESFMPIQSDRLSYYTAIFSIMKEEEIDEVVEELKDQFGKFPKIIERLIMVAKLRYHASFALFERVVIQRDKISITLPGQENESFYQEKFSLLMKFIMEKYPKTVEFKQNKKNMKLLIKNSERSPEKAIILTMDFCKKISQNIINKN